MLNTVDSDKIQCKTSTRGHTTGLCEQSRMSEESTCYGREEVTDVSVLTLRRSLQLLNVNDSKHCAAWIANVSAQTNTTALGVNILRKSFSVISAPFISVCSIIDDVPHSGDFGSGDNLATSPSPVSRNTTAPAGNSSELHMRLQAICANLTTQLAGINSSLMNETAVEDHNLRHVQSKVLSLNSSFSEFDSFCRQVSGRHSDERQPLHHQGTVLSVCADRSLSKARSVWTTLASIIHSGNATKMVAEFASLAGKFTLLEAKSATQKLTAVDFAAQSCRILFPPCLDIVSTDGSLVSVRALYCPVSCEEFDERLLLLRTLLKFSKMQLGLEALSKISAACYSPEEFGRYYGGTSTRPPCCMTISGNISQQQQLQLRSKVVQQWLHCNEWEKAVGRRQCDLLPTCPEILRRTNNTKHWVIGPLKEFSKFFLLVKSMWPSTVQESLSAVTRCGYDCNATGFTHQDRLTGQLFVTVITLVYISLFVIAAVCFVKYRTHVLAFPMRFLAIINVIAFIQNVTVFLPGALVDEKKLLCFSDNTLASGWSAVTPLCSAETALYILTTFGSLTIWFAMTHAMSLTLSDISSLKTRIKRSFTHRMEACYYIAAVLVPVSVLAVARMTSSAEAFPLYDICSIPIDQWIYFIIIPVCIYALAGSFFLVRCIICLKHIVKVADEAARRAAAVKRTKSWMEKRNRLRRLLIFCQLYIISSAFCHVIVISCGVAVELEIRRWQDDVAKHFRCSVATCRPGDVCGELPHLAGFIYFLSLGAVLINSLVSLSWLFVIRCLVRGGQQRVRRLMPSTNVMHHIAALSRTRRHGTAHQPNTDQLKNGHTLTGNEGSNETNAVACMQNWQATIETSPGTKRMSAEGMRQSRLAPLPETRLFRSSEVVSMSGVGRQRESTVPSICISPAESLEEVEAALSHAAGSMETNPVPAAFFTPLEHARPRSDIYPLHALGGGPFGFPFSQIHDDLWSIHSEFSDETHRDGFSKKNSAPA